MIDHRDFINAALMLELAKRLDDEKLQEVVDFCDEQARASGAADSTRRYYANVRDSFAQFLAEREPV